MKKSFNFLIAIIFLASSCTIKEKPAPAKPVIQGTWELIAVTTIKNDSVTLEYLDERTDLMMVGDKYICYIWQADSISESDIYPEGFAFGTYTFADGIYKDSTMFSTMTEAIGQISNATIEFIGDTIVMTMDLPDYPEINYESWFVRYK
jgi:hypothetical protein